MKSHVMQVEILSLKPNATGGKPIIVERPIGLTVIEEFKGPFNKSQNPLVQVVIIEGVIWIQVGREEGVEYLPDDYMLYTTALEHWRNSEVAIDRTPSHFAALHSETSRMVARVLYEFEWHPRWLMRAHDKLSFDRLAICKAADLMNQAEKALFEALPHLQHDQVKKLVEDHFKRLTDGVDPARILTNLPTDILG